MFRGVLKALASRARELDREAVEELEVEIVEIERSNIASVVQEYIEERVREYLPEQMPGVTQRTVLGRERYEFAEIGGLLAYVGDDKFEERAVYPPERSILMLKERRLASVLLPDFKTEDLQGEGQYYILWHTHPGAEADSTEGDERTFARLAKENILDLLRNPENQARSLEFAIYSTMNRELKFYRAIPKSNSN